MTSYHAQGNLNPLSPPPDSMLMFMCHCVYYQMCTCVQSVCVYACILERNKRLAYPLSRIPAAFIGINKANVSYLNTGADELVL